MEDISVLFPFIFFVFKIILFFVFLYLYFKLLYSAVINRKTIDKLGRKWMRIISQIFIVLPLGAVLLGVYISVMHLSEAYRIGCTSGPAMGDCFSHMIFLFISLPASLIATIVGYILYRFATNKPQV